MKWVDGRSETYSANNLVEGQHAIGNVGEVEGSGPSALILLQLVVDDHARADDHVCGSESSKADQGFLANAEPWRVADAQKDGLELVSMRREGEMRNIRGRPSWQASEGAQ
jgi:hypothetical protein